MPVERFSTFSVPAAFPVTKRLLFRGLRAHVSRAELAGSAKTRRHRPLLVDQRRSVASAEALTRRSFEADHSKAEMAARWPRRMKSMVAGEGFSWQMLSVPSAEAAARRDG